MEVLIKFDKCFPKTTNVSVFWQVFNSLLISLVAVIVGIITLEPDVVYLEVYVMK